MPHNIADMAYGVSNSFRRYVELFLAGGLPRTYSRRTRLVDDDGPPRKLIRMDDEGFVKIETNMVRASNNRDANKLPYAEAVTNSSTAPDTSQQDQHENSSNAPSTPVRESIFSDPSHQASSPLSSPSHSPPAAKTYKPAFSLLKRKRSSSGAVDGGRESTEASRPGTPLSEITGNDRYASQTQAGSGVGGGRGQPAAKKAKLTQLTLDLGQDARRACKGCGMSYVASSAEDTAIHKAFHATNIAGVDVGRGFAREARSIGSGAGDGEVVVAVDRKSAPALRRKVERVLDVVHRDLGALDIAPDRLWGSMPCPVSGRKVGKALLRAKEKGEEEEPREDCFKAFLFLDRDKCVGLCLAERISGAMKVADTDTPAQQSSLPTPQSDVTPTTTATATTTTAATTTTTSSSSSSVGGGAGTNKHAAGIKSSSITAAKTTDTVLLGISRIWTSRSHRRKGIASALLDCARGNYFYGIEIPKDMVAFSQPTESGGQLAQRWYERRTGWHVYES